MTYRMNIGRIFLGLTLSLGFSAAVHASPKPDYAQSINWAALPETVDQADLTPSGIKDQQTISNIDIFFVHPTTYLLGKALNADMSDSRVNELTDTKSIRNQASIFNGAGGVFAPRYRQGKAYAYTHHDDDSFNARELAYSDVLSAFDYYIQHRQNGRPFIIAGHSQGSHHAMRLLEERISHKPLKSSLVAAYLVGVPMPMDKFERTLTDMSLCDRPGETGCIISWNTVSGDGDKSRFLDIWHHYPTGWERNNDKALACVNPISWSSNGALATSQSGRRAISGKTRGKLRRVYGTQRGQCVNGLLEISKPRSWSLRPSKWDGGNYHVFDYSLFHFDIRDNLKAQIN